VTWALLAGKVATLTLLWVGRLCIGRSGRPPSRPPASGNPVAAQRLSASRRKEQLYETQ
jgi:hypothetical protein